MTRIFKVATVAVAIIGVLTGVFYLITGHVPWQGLQLNPTEIKLQEKISQLKRNARVEQVYKWQDEDGVWHFSNELPPQGVPYQQVDVDPDVNVVPSVSAETAEGN